MLRRALTSSSNGENSQRLIVRRPVRKYTVWQFLIPLDGTSLFTIAKQPQRDKKGS